MVSPRPPPIEPGSEEGIHTRAVDVGALVDIGATFVLGTLLLASYSGSLGIDPGAEPEQVAEALAADAGFLAWSTLVGAVCTALGGFVAARRAGRFHVQHGAVVGVVAVAVGVLFALTPSAGPPAALWYQLTGVALSLAAGALGGLVAGSRTDEMA